MQLRADFTKREAVGPDDETWRPSPTPGIDRWMLDRIGDEVARATSIVRYAPDSRFPSHTHGGGEEFLVLDGLFLDEAGRYPAGTYVRNPIGTSHSPAAGPDGAVLFVKLHQFDPGDQKRLVIDTKALPWQSGPIDGVEILPLHRFGPEAVTLQRWAPDTRLPTRSYDGGAEVLVLAGRFSDESGTYPTGTWLRLPQGHTHGPVAGPAGVQLYVKTGHLQA